MLIPTSFEEGESKKSGWNSIEPDEKSEAYGTAYWIGSEKSDTTNLKGDDSRIIMDRVIPFIEKSVVNKKPFFTTVWIHTPHLPLVADPAHREQYSKMDLQKQNYYGAITAMDEQMGRLWAKLGELNIQKETIIMFCSDNGPENKTPGSTGPFRGRKRSLYEGGLRVPAFAIWKGHLDGGQRLDFPSVTSDYLPTILDILKLEYPDNRPVDGETIWPLLTGEKKKREKPIGFLFRQQISWVDNKYKLISVDNGESFELYNLINDRAEKENIVHKEPEIATKMKRDLFEWISSVENSKKGLDYN